MNCCLGARGRCGGRGGPGGVGSAAVRGLSIFLYARGAGTERQRGRGELPGRGFGPPATAPPSQPCGGGLSPARGPPSVVGLRGVERRGGVPGPRSPSLGHSPLAGNQVPTRRATSTPVLAGGATLAGGPLGPRRGVQACRLGEECQFLPTLAPPPLPAWHVFLWGRLPAACCSSPSPAPPPPTPTHPPSTPHQPPLGTAPLLPPPLLPWGARRGAGTLPPAWPSCDGVPGPAGLMPC